MKKLRSFIYLDNYKMYSISSQLFEGLTEYIVRSNNESTREEENQRGPIASGRVLADIIEKNTNETEKKFLHDYSYNLFEDKLIDENRVLELNSQNIKEKISTISNYSFVKVSGNVIFNDLKIIEDTVRNFNEIGEALGFLSLKGQYEQEVSDHLDQIQDRNQKAKAQSILKSKNEFKKSLKGKGLQMDQEFLDHIAYVLSYGYNQQFEVQIPINLNSNNYYLFSAQLKRENLKDDELSIIKKYSRETEKEFQLFGIVTQRLTDESKKKLIEDLKKHQNIDQNNINGMKEAVMNIVSTITNLEQTFTGKLNYEYVIDPISLYLEI